MSFKNLIAFFFHHWWQIIRTHKSWPANLVFLGFALFVLLVAFIDIHFGIL